MLFPNLGAQIMEKKKDPLCKMMIIWNQEILSYKQQEFRKLQIPKFETKLKRFILLRKKKDKIKHMQQSLKKIVYNVKKETKKCRS